MYVSCSFGKDMNTLCNPTRKCPGHAAPLKITVRNNVTIKSLSINVSPSFISLLGVFSRGQKMPGCDPSHPPSTPPHTCFHPDGLHNGLLTFKVHS